MFKWVVISLSIFLLIVPFESGAQDDPMMVGFQYRPIFKNKFFTYGNTDFEQNGVRFTIGPRLGYSYGMVIRQPFLKRWAFEGGINYIKRNYIFAVDDLDSSFATSANFGIVEYEIPLSALVYIRLTEKFYMNTSAGFSLNMFKNSEKEIADNLTYTFLRSSWINFALVANVGWEYRTNRSGYFYLGTTYQLPFGKIITMFADYSMKSGAESMTTNIGLSFFTIDFKYFLPSTID